MSIIRSVWLRRRGVGGEGLDERLSVGVRCWKSCLTVFISFVLKPKREETLNESIAIRHELQIGVSMLEALLSQDGLFTVVGEDPRIKRADDAHCTRQDRIWSQVWEGEQVIHKFNIFSLMKRKVAMRTM